jgi:ribosome-binding factor A
VSQRTQKVESLVRQTVATAITHELGPGAARITVTAVDVSPDLKNATVWLGILEGESKRHKTFESVQDVRPALQSAVAKTLTTKYVPKIELKLDTGGDYAQHIADIIREL